MKVLQLCFIVLAFTACTRKEKTPSDTLVIGIAAAPPTLDPRFSTDAVGSNMAGLLFSSLVRMDEKLKIVPDLAESWTYKNLVFEFKLRPGLTFSDGSPLRKEDLLFSFKEFQADLSPHSSVFKKFIRVEAQYTEHERFVRLYLKEFSNTALGDLTLLKILPQKVVSQYGKDFYAHLVGSGGFELKKNSDSEILLEARPGYFRQSHFKKVLFKVVRDDNSRFQRMYKGDLDVVQADMPLSKIEVFKTSPRFEVFTGPGLHVTYLLINLRHPLLKELPVRQALAQAIDKESIIKYKLEGYATPASTFIPPISPYYDNSLQAEPFDLQKAKELIAPYLKEGQVLELKTSNQASAVENGKILSHQLEQLGLEISLKSFEWGTYYEDIKRGQFQLATMRFVGVVNPDIYKIAFHSLEAPPAGKNRGFYSNKSLDPLLEQGEKIENTLASIDHYKKIQRIVLKDIPAIPLWYDQYVTVVNKRIKNYVFSPNNSFAFVYDVDKIVGNDEAKSSSH